MTSPEESKGHRSRDEILAGEYVLGVLSLHDRQRVEDRIRRDPAFAAMVETWEANLSSFNGEYAETTPPAANFGRIEARLFGEERDRNSFVGGLWESAALWRSLTFASLAVAACIALFTSGFVPQSGKPAQLVADLSAADSKVALRASYSARDGLLKVIPVAAGNTQSASLQLWLVPNGNAPLSLGVFQADSDGELVIPAKMRERLVNGATLAVSLEPFGGSPTDQPTGPVVAAGAIRAP